MVELHDKELGKIVVIRNKRAKNVIARKKQNHIQLTVPYLFSLKRISTVLNSLRPKLLELKPPKTHVITENSVIETFSFVARISRTHLVQNLQMKLKDRELIVFIPSGFDLEQESSQLIVKEMIRSALRHEAKRILPPKTRFFAEKFNLQVNSVKINKSVSRWGSCSQKKNINFSFYLLLLPEKFIDYVVLHELAHTVEMNHSENFWKLLSSFCGEDAKAISKSLRKYRSEAYELLKQ